MAGFDQLLSCARDDNVEGIVALLQMGCPPSFSNRVGQSALHIGAMWGSVAAVKALLEAKANPNHQNQLRGSAPLHAAACGRGPADKRADCAKLIIKYKGDPKMPDNDGDTPMLCAEEEVVRLALGAAPMILHNAVRAHKLQNVKDALNQINRGSIQNLSVDSGSASGETALHLAVASGWFEAVQVLLEAEADPSLQNYQLRSPLHTAVITGNHQILKALLDANAYVEATDRDPEHDARFSSTSFEETPERHRTALHYAASFCNAIATKSLLEAKSDINAKDSQSQTPLHLCVERRENSEVDVGCGVRVTGLKNKPDWNDCQGSALGTPVALDGDESNVRCPVLLQFKDAKIPQQAVLLKPVNLELVQEEALDLLLSAKADVIAGSNVIGESRTVLHVAARTGDVSLARKLLEAGINIDQVDSKQGFSALHLAARGKHVEMVRLLVEGKAQVGLCSSIGKTAGDLAKTNGAGAEILELLSSEAPAASSTKPTTFADLTPEQKALLFIE